MHILGLACGSPNGNSEILLKAALKAAEASVPGTTVSILKINELAIPGHLGAGLFNPFQESDGPGPGSMTKKPPLSHPPPNPEGVKDDRPQARNAILHADAIIIASPTYTRQAAGILKYFVDKTLGPFVDVVFTKRVMTAKEMGDPRFAHIKPDPRVLKPRVVGLISVSGSSAPEWSTMALPTLHQCVFSMRAKVVDQIQVYRRAFPGSVLAENPDNAIARAQRLGENVASQLGQSYENARYLGEEGLCPHCHLNMVVLSRCGSGDIECATCGASGRLDLGVDGKFVAKIDEKVTRSVFSMEGLEAHALETDEIEKEIMPQMPALADERKWYKQLDETMLEKW